MDLNFIKLGITLSLILFGGGYLVRDKDIFLHKIMNSAGILMFLLSGLYSAALLSITGTMETSGIRLAAPEPFLYLFLAAALVSLLLMLTMAVTGILGKKVLHKKIHFIFFVVYINLYISGLFIFQNITN